jgi:hypothetical protein
LKNTIPTFGSVSGDAEDITLHTVTLHGIRV